MAGKGRILVAGRVAIWKARGASADAPFLHVEIADTFFRRFLGLMGRKGLAPSHALLLSPCSSIHMCFMRFSIDVVYVKNLGSGVWQVIKLTKSLHPWYGFSACMEADAALEMGRGETARLGIEPGSEWEEVR